MEILLSFSQDLEDIILYHILKEVKGPIHWIDVGANDPVFLSVTKFFSLRGGWGINIEPQKKLIDKLNEDRKADINLQIGIGNKCGELELHGEGLAASFDPNNAIVGKEPTELIVVEPLSKVWSEYVVNKIEHIHFLKIDVEGYEKQCLEGMNFTVNRPWVMCIESSIPGTSIPSWDKWEKIVLENGYRFIGTSDINRYYVANEHEELFDRFCHKDNLKKEYTILKYEDASAGEKIYREMRMKRSKRMKRKIKILHSPLLLPARKIYRLIRYGNSKCE